MSTIAFTVHRPQEDGTAKATLTVPFKNGPSKITSLISEYILFNIYILSRHLRTNTKKNQIANIDSRPKMMPPWPTSSIPTPGIRVNAVVESLHNSQQNHGKCKQIRAGSSSQSRNQILDFLSS